MRPEAFNRPHSSLLAYECTDGLLELYWCTMHNLVLTLHTDLHYCTRPWMRLSKWSQVYCPLASLLVFGLDQKPGLVAASFIWKFRIALHPHRGLFIFPTPLFISLEIQVRVVGAISYFWQFLCPSALRDALRVWFGGCLYRFLRLPMGLRYAVAAGQSPFSYGPVACLRLLTGTTHTSFWFT